MLFDGKAQFASLSHQQWVDWVRRQDHDGRWSNWLDYVTHALDRMPLRVDLFDHEGNLPDRKTSAGEEHGFGAGFSSSFARQRPVQVRL